MLGIDASNVNGPINWAKVAASGVKFAWIKGTEGETFDDGSAAVNTSQARAHGILVGLYHFARPDLHPFSPESEAMHFVGVARSAGALQLRPVLDFEKPAPHLSPAQMTSWALRWMQAVEKELGVRPVFYSYPDFIVHTMGGAHGLQDYLLWLASFGPNDGREHPAAAVGGWKAIAVHQFTSNGHVDGVSGHVDLDDAQSTALLAHPPAPSPLPKRLWPNPLPAWFWDWAGWRIAMNELGDKSALKAHRPASAPRVIPLWAWRRLVALLKQK